MAVTISLIVVSVIFPIFMIIFGRWLSNNAPKDINYVVGYRTKRSMASKEAWDYANSTAGKYWAVTGIYCIPVFIIIGLVVSYYVNRIEIDESRIVYVFVGIVLLQLIPFLSVIPYTESKLKKRKS